MQLDENVLLSFAAIPALTFNDQFPWVELSFWVTIYTANLKLL